MTWPLVFGILTASAIVIAFQALSRLMASSCYKDISTLSAPLHGVQTRPLVRIPSLLREYIQLKDEPSWNLDTSSSFDSTARLWDSVTGRCLKVISDHKRPVYTLSFSPNGRWLATGSGDGWIHIYSVIVSNFNAAGCCLHWLSRKSYEKKWSWYAGPDRPGVYEIDWQVVNGFNRIALALECSLVAVIDVDKIPALRDG